MTLPPPSPDERSRDRPPTEATSADPLAEVDRDIQDVERSLSSLKQRFLQVQRDRQQQEQLEHRRDDLRQQIRHAKSSDPTHLPQLKTELKQIQAQLEAIELNLENELSSSTSLTDFFWQAVRFGGIGIIIGWLLRACAN